jgi:hypothetical protein
MQMFFCLSKMHSDDASNTARVEAHYLQWPTSLNVAQVRVPIEGVFMKVVTESDTCEIRRFS